MCDGRYRLSRSWIPLLKDDSIVEESSIDDIGDQSKNFNACANHALPLGSLLLDDDRKIDTVFSIYCFCIFSYQYKFILMVLNRGRRLQLPLSSPMEPQNLIVDYQTNLQFFTAELRALLLALELMTALSKNNS